MQARIYKPARNAMQQGEARTHTWVLEFEADGRRVADPLMGWTGSTDTRQQLRLRFDSRDAAIAYAERHGIPYRVHEPHRARLRIKAYADNFR